MANKKRNKVFEEIDNIKQHPTYLKAMDIATSKLWKWFAYTVTTIVLIIGLLIGLFLYDSHVTGKQCMKDCEAEHLSDNCNDWCF